jgi:hypothetical protein
LFGSGVKKPGLVAEQELSLKNPGRKLPATFDGANAGWLHPSNVVLEAAFQNGTSGSGVEPWLIDQGPFGLVEFDQSEERS